jgi:hypothetical protein
MQVNSSCTWGAQSSTRDDLDKQSHYKAPRVQLLGKGFFLMQLIFISILILADKVEIPELLM